MKIRFADLISPQPAANSNVGGDFTVRDRRPLWQSLCLLFFAVLVTSVFLGMIVSNIVLFSEILFVILIGVGTYVLVVLQNNRDLVMSTEFQNALLSSALSASNKFCLIIKDDGSIVHIDTAFQKLFPDFAGEVRLTVDSLLNHAQVSKEDRKIVFTAIDRRVYDQVIFDIIDAKNQPHRIMMHICPIARPKGFILLRGREFIEKRILGSQPDDGKTPIFNKSTMGMFAYIMDSLEMGAYVVNQIGNIVYVNPKLEEWLYFEEEEIISLGLSLKDIMLQTGIETAITNLENFEGEALLQRKIGGSIKTSVNQKSIFDEGGNIIGYAAVVHRIDEKPADKKNGLHKKDTW